MQYYLYMFTIKRLCTKNLIIVQIMYKEYRCLKHCNSYAYTPLKTNLEPENRPLQEEIPFGNHHFQVFEGAGILARVSCRENWPEPVEGCEILQDLFFLRVQTSHLVAQNVVFVIFKGDIHIGHPSYLNCLAIALKITACIPIC